MSDFYTGRGDDGTTSLLGEERVPKFHPRPEAYGAIDEASAALGMARSLSVDAASQRAAAQVQRDLYGIMAEVAATPDNAEKFRSVGPERVEWLESQMEYFGERVAMPQEFVIGGDTRSGAAFDMARTVVRRAERRVVELFHEGDIENAALVAYLNRLSSLCFVLALWENVQGGVDQPSLAKGADVS